MAVAEMVRLNAKSDSNRVAYRVSVGSITRTAVALLDCEEKEDNKVSE
jgi:hypothetical protein